MSDVARPGTRDPALSPGGAGSRSRWLRPWMLVSAAWIVPAILAAFESYMQGWLASGREQSWRALLWQGLDWLIYGGLTPLVFWLARRLPLRRPRLGRNTLLHLLASLVLCAAWAATGVGLRVLLLPGSGGWATARGLASWFFTSLPFGVAVYFCVLGIEHAIYYFLETRRRETETARLLAQLADARLGALRMQLNPHFLLNSLNAITVLVRDRDTPGAVRMLEELGEVLHQVLRTDRPQEVTLAEELAFLRRYLAIEQVRFADRLQASIEVSPEARAALVPDFILQPLVENALRHGLGRSSEAGLVEIRARREGRDLVVTVRDDGPGLEPGDAEPAGLGLRNTRERLRTLYGDEAVLQLAGHPDGGATATLRLPFREGAPPRPEPADG
jgi:two-component system, LytTR family, sensor kinase